MKESWRIHLFWLINSIAITVLAHIFQSPGPEYTGGPFYIAWTLIYGIAVWIFIPKKSILPVPSLGVFCIGLVIILLGEPLFENDHYRYIWESKVFFKGFNPYLTPPEAVALDGVEFTHRKDIGFPYLPGIYPPLALVWFYLAGAFKYDFGLRVLQLANGFLVWFLWRQGARFKWRLWPLVLLFPFFQKEFIQSVHLDLVAAIPLIFYFQNSGPFKNLLSLFLSYQLKVLGLALLPFQFFRGHPGDKSLKRWGYRGAVFLVIMSLPFLWSWAHQFKGDWHGMRAFSSYWVWNPGFYSLLHRLFGLASSQARVLTTYGYGLYLIWLAIMILRCVWRQKWIITNRQIMQAAVGIFAGLLFFTPVYNPWYCIWMLIPSLLLGLRLPIIYAFFSCFSYAFYGVDEVWLPLGELMTHLWFFPLLWELRRHVGTR